MYVHIVEIKSARGHNREDDNRARIPKKKCIKRQKKHKSMLFYTATAIFANIIAMRMNEEENGKKI